MDTNGLLIYQDSEFIEELLSYLFGEESECFKNSEEQ